MTVLCGACGAENRDAAKFCKGCGRKIDQAWPQATPVAALSADAALLLNAAAPAPRTAAAPQKAAAEETLRPAPAPPRARMSNGRWILGLAIGVALLVLAAAWWGHRNRSQEIADPVAPAVDVPSAATTDPPAAEGTAPAPAPTVVDPPALAAPSEMADMPPLPPAEEAAAPASPKTRKPAPRKQVTPPPVPAVEPVAPAPLPPPAIEPVRVPAPQESCAGRNFIARAQCLAEQCARPEVARHPQCEAVRQQQRIEEEKRNPTMAG